MKCLNCGCLNKGEGKCDLCGHQMTPEVVEEVYVIPKKSKKRQAVIDEDIAFFQEIWAEREHYCEVTGEFLGDEFNVVFFSHLLTKAAYPRFRNYKKNIKLMSFRIHQLWEFSDRKDPMFNDLRDEAEDLVIEYYNPPTV
jgi:hypothetical protein